MKSVIYLNKEQQFGQAPITNGDKPTQMYSSPFTLSEDDREILFRSLHHEISDRIYDAINRKGYTMYTIHWGAKLVLYWKE